MADRRLRLLCLDGGGIRGLASLYLLKKILSRVGNPKPCEFFDMICGTSTGGLIAIMLGRLEMTIQECIDAFTSMMDAIFKQKHTLPFRWYDGKVQARYDTAALENSIKAVIQKYGHADAKMRGGGVPTCKVFVVAMTGEAKTPVQFTNYPKEGDASMYDEATILDAALATSAATTFFKPHKILSGGVPRTFHDGALGNNNPINRLWVEAKEQYGPAPLENQIRCLLSVGTGKPALTDFGESVKDVASSIAKIATETQATADNFHEHHESLANRDGYFRFNPPDISDIGLDEVSKRATIETRTEAFVNDPVTKQDMDRFQVASYQVGEEQKSVRRVGPVPIHTKLFYTLGDDPKSLLRKNYYWEHLTLDSYYVYERIFHDCKPTEGRVPTASFLSFLGQFNQFKPGRRKIRDVWSRLLRENQRKDVPSSHHPQGFVMAVIYMLHVETTIGKEQRPRMDDGGDGIETRTRETLKRFAKWVQCQCRYECGKEWNFVNERGLCRPRKGRKCGVERYLGRAGWGDLLHPGDLRAFERTKRAWEEKEGK